jgi:RNA polymerase sigma-70 factor (TIGR02943 family)
MSIELELEQHRTYLLRFARLQLRNDAWAEDAVSETLLAALAKPHSFANKSQLKTWLVGILKHKVIDVLRVQTREASINFDDESEGRGSSDELDALMFKPDGHYVSSPMNWDSANPNLGDHPERNLSTQQFFMVLEACTEKLPVAQGRIFLMREWLELSVDEICEELNLTSTNLYVQLHRARLRLRECLELNWFGLPAAEKIQ